MQTKIKSLDEIQAILERNRQSGSRIVQCHGVFDLLHPGHFRHFKEAKQQGDLLVVSVTPDRFVNKGPGRPFFSENLRLESLAALEDIDYVVLNDSPDGISAIKKIRPSLYVKGVEYANHSADVTGKISVEAQTVEEIGGKIYYTDDIVFSSSSLLNQYFDSRSPETIEFINHLKTNHPTETIINRIESLRELKVLVIGDAIIDEYQYVDPIGHSGKGSHMVAKCLHKEVFLGGSLIIANHVAQFSDNVTLLTAIGSQCPYSSFIKNKLDPKVHQEFIYLEDSSTLIKKRYAIKDGSYLSKLFETYSNQEKGLDYRQSSHIVNFLSGRAEDYDLILVADFGNGFTNAQIVDAISHSPSFVAVNTQTNSGNRGYNMITNYEHADYISLNEPELRLALHDKSSHIDGLATDILDIMNCPRISVTRGIKGVICYSKEENPITIPAFASHSIDRIGAGDAYLSLSSLCLSKKMPFILAGFIGSLAAAMSVQMIGNQDAIGKSSLMKYLIRLMK